MRPTPALDQAQAQNAGQAQAATGGRPPASSLSSSSPSQSQKARSQQQREQQAQQQQQQQQQARAQAQAAAASSASSSTSPTVPVPGPQPAPPPPPQAGPSVVVPVPAGALGAAPPFDAGPFLMEDAARYGLAVDASTMNHEGLQVFTVGHLMPRSSLEDANGNWAFDASVLNQVVMPTPEGMGGDPEEEGESSSAAAVPGPTGFISAPAPSSASAAGSSAGSGRPGSAQTLRVRRSTYVPGWAVPPRVLLVDDDAVSRKVSSKFLQIFGCTIDVAVDGVGAVNKMNLEKYDLVLMVRACACGLKIFLGRPLTVDLSLCALCSAHTAFLFGCVDFIFLLRPQDIVMPKLDGVSATSLIRQFDHMTPIISMTSNSKPAEIMKYYSSGMNDHLPKPFTKDGLWEVLEKHLTHLKVIQTLSRVPRSVGVPPLSDPSFDNALAVQASAAQQQGGALPLGFSLGAGDEEEGKINPLAGMGLTDEQYTLILSNLVNGESFQGIDVAAVHGLGESSKRSLDDPHDGREPKRSRFEVIE